MTHGASPVSLHKPWVALIPPPQHALAPPGLPVQPDPAHSPQLRGQLQRLSRTGEKDEKGEKETGGDEPRLFPAYTHDVLYEVRPFLDPLLNIDGLSLHSSPLLGADEPNDERGFCAYFASSA